MLDIAVPSRKQNPQGNHADEEKHEKETHTPAHDSKTETVVPGFEGPDGLVYPLHRHTQPILTCPNQGV